MVFCSKNKLDLLSFFSDSLLDEGFSFLIEFFFNVVILVTTKGLDFSRLDSGLIFFAKFSNMSASVKFSDITFFSGSLSTIEPVSYTHLTLPTSDLV